MDRYNNYYFKFTRTPMMPAISYSNTANTKIYVPTSAACTTDYSYDYNDLRVTKYTTFKWNTCSVTDTADTWSTNKYTTYDGACTTSLKYGAWGEAEITFSTKDYYWHTQDQPQPSVSDRIKQIIQDRMAPMFIRDRKSLEHPLDIREIRARQTLNRVIGDEKYQDFLKKGFISVRGKSGLIYQIFPAHGITNVYERGKMVERLCVVLTGNFPPTDSLIMRYLLILNNEQSFREKAIKHQVYLPVKSSQKKVDGRNLMEIFSGLRRKAA